MTEETKRKYLYNYKIRKMTRDEYNNLKDVTQNTEAMKYINKTKLSNILQIYEDINNL